jgi:cytochrome c5
VDAEKHDKNFLVTFTLVVGFIGAFAVAIGLLARVIGKAEAEDPAAIARMEERIKPVGQVITDPSKLLEVAAAAPARAPMTGEQVVTKVCSACHGTGVLNAPKIGDKAAWAKLKAMGVKALVASAIKGKNQMPPRGGDPSLSDDEMKAAVEQMLKQTGI